MPTIIIEGWFFKAEAKTRDKKDVPVEEPLINSLFLNPAFQKSVRRFELADLWVTEVQKIQGSVFNPTYVREVVDLTRSQLPFYISETKVTKLQELINSTELAL
jgi:hypothetical protein